MALTPMYKGQRYSPQLKLTNSIDALQNTIQVTDENYYGEYYSLPLPNIFVIGGDTEYGETILVTNISKVSGTTFDYTVQRGWKGDSDSWGSGTIIGRNFTAYDYNTTVDNINTINSDLVAHKADNAKQSLLVRQEVIDIKLKLSEALVYEFLNKTGIGFYDLFASVDYIDTNETTASVNIGDNKVVFSGLKKLVMLEQGFMNFTDVELALYDLDRASLQVEDNSNTNKIEVLIPPSSINVGDKFMYENKVYTVTSTEQI